MKIGVIGTGYVGLVAGACFADTGNTVWCVDRDPSKIERLKRGEIPIYEPGLEELVKRGVSEGRLHFTTSTPDAVKACEILFMAVGTPASESGEPDMSYLKQAAEEVARALPSYRLIVNKSTVPIGTHLIVAEWMRPLTSHAFDVVSNPEFLKEGSAVEDFLRPDRVIIGTDKDEVYKKMEALYAPFVRQGNPILRMDPISAEMAKYACNAFLATRISFMNELAQLCDKVGGDIEQIRRGMTTDVRIGKHFLYAGAGYGGSCFPKDVQALLATSRRNDQPLGIVAATEEANQRQKKFLAQKIQSVLGRDLKGKTFAIWGLAFKPNTDDIREAPALVVIEELLRAGARIRAYDPVAIENAEPLIQKIDSSGRVAFCESPYEALEGSDALVLVTEWNEFRQVDFARVKSALKQPLIFDGRNLYDPREMQAQGLSYYSVGRPSVRG